MVINCYRFMLEYFYKYTYKALKFKMRYHLFGYRQDGILIMFRSIKSGGWLKIFINITSFMP